MLEVGEALTIISIFRELLPEARESSSVPLTRLLRKMKILLAEDHPLYRQALRELLTQLDEGVEWIEATNYDELTESVRQEGPSLDLILLDLSIPGGDGFEEIKRIRGQLPAVKIAVVTASESPAHARRALRCGAVGYIPKTVDNQIMLSALRLILSGGVYVPPMLIGQKLKSQTKTDRERRKAAAPIEGQQALTRRQQDVLRLLSKGRSNKQVAHELGIAQGTVKLHVSAIFKALGVSNRTEATLKAAELGFGDSGD